MELTESGGHAARRALITTAAAAAWPMAAKAEVSFFPKGSVFQGTYRVESAPGAKTGSVGDQVVITVRAGEGTLRGRTDGRAWKCRATRIQGVPVILRLAGMKREIWFDFSPVGGASELRGVYEGNMFDNENGNSGDQAILWDDGSRWAKLSDSTEDVQGRS